ncbi:MAG: hypothetical protein WCY12_03740 [Candidatus Omnitrophota bacterium]
MDKRYLWLLFVAAIVFLLMVAGINMYVKSAQDVQPLNPVTVAAPAVTVKTAVVAEQEPVQAREREEPVYEKQLPKGEVLLN